MQANTSSIGRTLHWCCPSCQGDTGLQGDAGCRPHLCYAGLLLALRLLICRLPLLLLEPLFLAPALLVLLSRRLAYVPPLLVLPLPLLILLALPLKSSSSGDVMLAATGGSFIACSAVTPLPGLSSMP